MLDFKVTILRRYADLNASDDNVDAEIEISDGRVYSATFFTLKNLESIMKSYKQTGECAFGRYVWAADMVIVEYLTTEIITECVRDLLGSGELFNACSRIR